MKPYFILFLLLFFSFHSSGQFSVTHPRVCNDANGKFNCYFDGHFSIQYKEGRFFKFRTADSLVNFYEDGRYFEFFDKQAGRVIARIILNDSSIQFEDGSRIEKFDSPGSRQVIFDKMVFTVEADKGHCHISTYAGNYFLSIRTNSFEKIWKWEELRMRADSISLFMNYNYFRYKGPDGFVIQNDSAKYGISISNTFRNNKRIWLISPNYFEDHTITILPEFHFQYNSKGIYRPRKSFGHIEICDCQ